MPIKSFPPVEYADPDGIVAVGGDLCVESLILAYSSGIFPWPIDPRTLCWFAPPKRAILRLEDFHVPSSLKKVIKRAVFNITIDKAFPSVIHSCSTSNNRTGQLGTWITPPMISAYCKLHEAGYAHSVEAWHGENLVGGLYGVNIGGFFAGESMYYTESNASKVALYHLVTHLKERGFSWIDCQVMTPTFKAFGAREITRDRFMAILKEALKKKLSLVD